MQPLAGLGVPITPDDRRRAAVDAFWDAPLDLNPQPRAWRESAAGRGHRRPAGAAAQGRRDYARDGGVPHRSPRGEDRTVRGWRLPLPGSSSAVRRTAAVHGLPRHRTCPHGGDRDNRSPVGRLQATTPVCRSSPSTRRRGRLARHREYLAVVPVRRRPPTRAGCR